MTIIVTRRRHFLVFHLEAKYEKKKKKKRTTKMNLREKLDKDHLNSKKSTLALKSMVNHAKSEQLKSSRAGQQKSA